MSEEGYEFYKHTRKVWSDAIKDKKQNKWIHEGWMEWSERNSFGGQWRRKKARTVVDQENESDSDADIDDANAGVIWSPEDEEFDSVDNIGNNGGKMTTMKWGKINGFMRDGWNGPKETVLVTNGEGIRRGLLWTKKMSQIVMLVLTMLTQG